MFPKIISSTTASTPNFRPAVVRNSTGNLWNNLPKCPSEPLKFFIIKKMPLPSTAFDLPIRQPDPESSKLFFKNTHQYWLPKIINSDKIWTLKKDFYGIMSPWIAIMSTWLPSHIAKSPNIRHPISKIDQTPAKCYFYLWIRIAQPRYSFCFSEFRSAQNSILPKEQFSLCAQTPLRVFTRNDSRRKSRTLFI